MRSLSNGFTVIELLVSSFLGLLILGLILQTVVINRRVYKQDVVKTRINQNVRSALDILGMNVRQAGEALPSTFPAMLVTDGNGGAADEIIMRRNLYENEILNVCQAIAHATANITVLFAYQTTNIACDYAAELSPYIAVWNNYRVSQGLSARAYIYNRSSKQGEFFDYTNVTDDALTKRMSVTKTSTPWLYDYGGDGNSSAMYLLEEYHYRVWNKTLQLIKNSDQNNLMNVVDGITNFQIRVNMMDGSVRESFGVNDLWTHIKSVEFSVAGTESFAGKPVNSTVTVKYFPRNILSN